jgi:quinol monooxygenase YgiN
MAGFIQIIDYTSSRADEIRVLAEKMRANREAGPGGPARVTMTEDRDRPGHFLTIAEFDSYEKAMENSNHPDTQEFAAAMNELVDGPPTFINLDLRDRWEN